MALGLLLQPDATLRCPLDNLRRPVDAPNSVRLALAALTIDQLDAGLCTRPAMLESWDNDFDSTGSWERNAGNILSRSSSRSTL